MICTLSDVPSKCALTNWTLDDLLIQFFFPPWKLYRTTDSKGTKFRQPSVDKSSSTTISCTNWHKSTLEWKINNLGFINCTDSKDYSFYFGPYEQQTSVSDLRLPATKTYRKQLKTFGRDTTVIVDVFLSNINQAIFKNVQSKQSSRKTDNG